ncbi:MAG: 30S ribosome-binding factor RbfA [Phycisphaerae bacterium]
MPNANIGLKRLESQIRLVISEAMQRKLADPRLDRLASITKVELTTDLSFADVCFSIMGTESQQRDYMQAINRAHRILQSMVAKILRTRTCPTLRFHLDQSIKKGFETMQLIDKSMAERAKREGEQQT